MTPRAVEKLLLAIVVGIAAWLIISRVNQQTGGGISRAWANAVDALKNLFSGMASSAPPSLHQPTGSTTPASSLPGTAPNSSPSVVGTPQAPVNNNDLWNGLAKALPTPAYTDAWGRAVNTDTGVSAAEDMMDLSAGFTPTDNAAPATTSAAPDWFTPVDQGPTSLNDFFGPVDNAILGMG